MRSWPSGAGAALRSGSGGGTGAAAVGGGVGGDARGAGAGTASAGAHATRSDDRTTENVRIASAAYAWLCRCGIVGMGICVLRNVAVAQVVLLLGALFATSSC